MPKPYTAADEKRAQELHAFDGPKNTLWRDGAVKRDRPDADTQVAFDDEDREPFLDEAQRERFAKEQLV